MGDRTDLYTAVYNLISGAISSYGASTSNITVYGGYPDTDLPTFPSVVIEPIESSERGSTKTIDKSRNVYHNDMVVIVHIFAKRNRDLDIIADGITTTLNTQTPGFILNDISDANGFLIANEQKVKLKTLTLNYLHR